MGGSQSNYPTEKELHERIMSFLFSYLEKHPEHADITIDESLIVYSGLNSAAVLEDHRSRLIRDLASKAPNYVTNLGSALSAFKSVPNAVGLGALVISLALDVIVSTMVEVPDDRNLNMLRRVFAEEKASGVRDTMDEYMKRLSMYLHDSARALEETKRLEPQLSEQLTCLRNSMLHDDEINPRAMKFWANAAAFHVQMLIHEARLMTAEETTKLDAQVATVSTVVGHYQTDLQMLLKKFFKMSEMKVSEDFVENLYNSWSQTKQLVDHFTTLQKNTRQLIMQHQTFNLQI